MHHNDEHGRQHTILIASDRADDAMGVYAAGHVVSRALLGAMIEDEIQIPSGEKARSATILRIARPSQLFGTTYSSRQVIS